MAYSYSTFVTALAAECALSESNTDFVAILPTIIDSAEGRIYRELDLLTASVTTAGTLTANSRSFTLPVTNGHVLAVDFISVLDATSERHVTIPASRDLVETLWPSDTAATSAIIPEMFARISDTAVLFGPPPGSAWNCEIVHTIRPNPLSVSNTTTFLTSYLSDLFFAAAMVRASGWMRNFGAQGDDPRQAVSWEAQFQTLLASAQREELRKQYVGTMSTPGGA